MTISNGATVGGTLPNFVAGAPGANVQDADISNALNSGTSVTVSTNGSAFVPEQGNLTMNAGSAITKTAGANATLTLNAHNNISILGNITSTSGALGIDLNSDSDGAGGGAISVGGFAPVSLLSNGGDIRFYGQGGPGTGRANSAPGSGQDGIRVLNATVDARVGQSPAGASGTILMRGQGSQLQFLSGNGVSIEASTLAASTGLIELNGLGGPGGNGVRVVAADPEPSREGTFCPIQHRWWNRRRAPLGHWTHRDRFWWNVVCQFRRPDWEQHRRRRQRASGYSRICQRNDNGRRPVDRHQLCRPAFAEFCFDDRRWGPHLVERRVDLGGSWREHHRRQHPRLCRDTGEHRHSCRKQRRRGCDKPRRNGAGQWRSQPAARRCRSGAAVQPG
ncbi:MAG: hypothetical protein IPL03_15450 [Sterolibacteriaceae bacterium]|nr:hypothetical protein [Candidatus Methylophosphatis haderslevensis]